jgi:Arc/MetJ family transcription regulator
MIATITLDDDLVKRAMQLTGIDEISYLLREALKSIIARESGRRLVLLGGSDPDIQPIPRRRSETE